LKDKFDIQGYFYKIQEYKCRKYLDIKNKYYKVGKPDLMIVMMNPGSSYPVDGNDDNCIATQAKPDNTQNQIMKIMENCGYKFSRVLNLSDLRTPNSNELYKFIGSVDSNKIRHSIFCDERKENLDSLYVKNVPVIYGWGVNAALAGLAKLAIKKINSPNPIGLKKHGSDYAYYHPLPRVDRKKQIEWVEKITEMLKCT